MSKFMTFYLVVEFVALESALRCRQDGQDELTKVEEEVEEVEEEVDEETIDVEVASVENVEDDTGLTEVIANCC